MCLQAFAAEHHAREAEGGREGALPLALLAKSAPGPLRRRLALRVPPPGHSHPEGPPPLRLLGHAPRAQQLQLVLLAPLLPEKPPSLGSIYFVGALFPSLGL